MAKLVLPATELEKVDVTRVALVKRGANRIPFRIVKSEDGEIMDLYKIARSVFHKADPKPAVTAVVLNKSGNVAAISSALIKAEIDLPSDLRKSDDDVIILGKADAEGVTLVKLDENTLIGVTELAKSFTDGLPEFNGYGARTVPSIGMAAKHLVDLVKAEMAKDVKPAELAAFIKEAATEFGDFASVMAANLPASVIKADLLLKAWPPAPEKTVPGDPEEVEGSECAPGTMKEKKKVPPQFMKADTFGNTEDLMSDNMEGTGTKQVVPSTDKDDDKNAITQTQKEEIQDNPGANLGSKTSEPFKVAGTNNDIDTDPKEGNPKGKTGPKVQESKGTTSNNLEGEPKNGSTTSEASSIPGGIKKEEIAALLKGMFDSLSTEVGSALSGMQKELAGIRKEAVSAMETARKAEEAVNGFVGAEPSDDRIGMRKAERSGGGVPPLLDTGFSRVA